MWERCLGQLRAVMGSDPNMPGKPMELQLQGQPAASNPSPVADSGYTQSLGKAGVQKLL